MDTARLFALALEASCSSYSPYSSFRVGAALLCSDGSLFIGTNVENRSFGLTICAERSAISAAIGSGQREFAGIVVATPDSDYPVSPCGACRQVLSEFMSPETPIAFGNRVDNLVVTTMAELLPRDALHDLKEQRL
jgi:cytidine deaminase